MYEQTNEEKKVVFNTPQGLDLDLLFGDLSIKFKPKAEFIIHQVNYHHKGGGYQVHSKNHCWFFGIKGSELALIINRLIESCIITKARNYKPGNTSNTYRMALPFDIATAQQSFYHPNEITFVKKWVLDNYIVKNAATSAFKKTRTTPSAIIASKQKEIDDLKAIIYEMRSESKGILLTDLSVENDSDALRVPEVITPTNAMPYEEVMMSETPDLPVQPLSDLSPAVEELPMQSPLPDTELSTDLSAVSEEELNELQSLFGGDSTTNTKGEIIQLPIAGVIATDELLDAVELTPPFVLKISDSKESVEETIPLDTKAIINDTLDSEMFMNGNLSIQPFEDTLCILYGDKVGCIENFEVIKPWCLRLPKNEKQRLYYSLITATGNIVNFPLNIHTKAKFKRKETDNGIIFTFDLLTAA